MKKLQYNLPDSKEWEDIVGVQSGDWFCTGGFPSGTRFREVIINHTTEWISYGVNDIYGQD